MPGRHCAGSQERVPASMAMRRSPAGSLDPQLALQLQTMARDGHKIQAIKLLRQATHTDLATAKKYVDRL